MPQDFLPSREGELVTWSAHFKSLITATPVAFGLTAGEATTYGGLHDSFAALYAASQADNTRTPSGIVAKDDAKALLIANARLLARQVQGTPSVTNAQKSDLGLTVRDTEPTPVPVPALSPLIEIVSVIGRVVRLRLKDRSGERRGKPAGCIGATIFTAVSESAPDSASDWKWEGMTGKTTVDIVFPDSVADGAQVWFTAQWFNSRKETGPGCPAVGTNVQGGAAMAA